MSTYFQDASGEIRLVGTLHAPGATTGDVLTVQADGSLAPAPGGGSQTVYDSGPIPLSSAQIKALATVPVELVPAPGPGFALLPLSFTWVYLAGDTPYDADHTFALDWDGDTSVLLSMNAGLFRADDRLCTSGAAASEARKTFAVCEDKALVVREADASPPVDGNGTGLAQVFYFVIPLSA